jgi:hypothetical protein
MELTFPLLAGVLAIGLASAASQFYSWLQRLLLLRRLYPGPQPNNLLLGACACLSASCYPVGSSVSPVHVLKSFSCRQRYTAGRH